SLLTFRAAPLASTCSRSRIFPSATVTRSTADAPAAGTMQTTGVLGSNRGSAGMIAAASGVAGGGATAACQQPSQGCHRASGAGPCAAIGPAAMRSPPRIAPATVTRPPFIEFIIIAPSSQNLTERPAVAANPERSILSNPSKPWFILPEPHVYFPCAVNAN